jgi:hypothetical protein
MRAWEMSSPAYLCSGLLFSPAWTAGWTVACCYGCFSHLLGIRFPVVPRCSSVESALSAQGGNQ